MPSEGSLTNPLTIVGKGVPSNYEISVDGIIEKVDADSDEEAVIVSDQAAEGTIETGVNQFLFSGEMANVHVIDWTGTPAPESPSTPEVHIDYGVPNRNDN